jgi:hypothetical protein
LTLEIKPHCPFNAPGPAIQSLLSDIDHPPVWAVEGARADILQGWLFLNVHLMTLWKVVRQQAVQALVSETMPDEVPETKSHHKWCSAGEKDAPETWVNDKQFKILG